jgi:hypothetical protein
MTGPTLFLVLFLWCWLWEAVTHLANGFWWEPVIDPATCLKVRVHEKTGDISLVGVAPLWNQGSCLPSDKLDNFTALLEMAFHGFGGGSTRMTELSKPTIFHCVYSIETIYYSLTSLKGFKSSSQRQCKKVERNFPPVITRFLLLFRSLINANESLFENLTLN